MKASPVDIPVAWLQYCTSVIVLTSHVSCVLHSQKFGSYHHRNEFFHVCPLSENQVVMDVNPCTCGFHNNDIALVLCDLLISVSECKIVRCVPKVALLYDV